VGETVIFSISSAAGGGGGINIPALCQRSSTRVFIACADNGSGSYETNVIASWRHAKRSQRHLFSNGGAVSRKAARAWYLNAAGVKYLRSAARCLMYGTSGLLAWRLLYASSALYYLISLSAARGATSRHDAGGSERHRLAMKSGALNK